MHIDRSHPDLPRWLTEATTEFQRENAEEALRRQRAKRYEEGEAALNAGQWAIAIESFEEVAQGNPDFREVQQKLTAARDELQRSLLYDEAIALGEAQQWPEATSMWLKVLRDRMDYHGGDAALRFTEAVRRLLDQWLILNETLAQSQQDLSAARRLLSDFDALGVTMNAHSWTEAIELAERLLSVSPDLLQPAVWLGDARRELELAEAHAKVPAVQLSLPESVAKLSGADRLMWLVDGKEMVRVPAGGFLFGDQNEKIDLPEFWIDKAPVTNAEYARFVAAKKYFPPAHWSGWQPPKDLIDHPVVNVSWIDAVAYANWANKRLPTEQEWEKAARGTDGRVYPWGDQEPTDKLCNFGQNVKNTTLVGKYSPQGDSPYGCVDMAGNVWEWTASDYDQSSKVLRSGSWSVDAYNVRTTGRNYITPDGRNVIFGFRCVVSPGG